METRKIETLEQLREIYNTRMKRDFARNELRSWGSLRGSWEQGAYECFGLFEGEALLGYACFLRQRGGEAGDNVLFDYLAIDEACRDRGLGSVFLRQLAGCITGAACILGEVEDPEAAEDAAARELRERRLRFYLRSGYRATAVRCRLFGVDYRILEIPAGREHSTEELREIYTALYRNLLPPALFRAWFHLKDDGGAAGEA